MGDAGYSAENNLFDIDTPDYNCTEYSMYFRHEKWIPTPILYNRIIL